MSGPRRVVVTSIVRMTWPLPRLRGLDLNLDYRDPRPVPDSSSNRIHLNAVARSPDGLLLS